MTLAEYKNKATQLEGKKSLIQKQYADAEQAKLFFSREVQIREEAQAIAQRVAKETQEQLKFHIEDIVQMALDTCFPGKYKFVVEFELKRGKTEATLLFMSDGQSIDPMEASGGGAVDVASFGLRIAAWSLSKTSPVIVLDEPFRFLSKDLQPLAGEVLKELSKTLGLQIILVTHATDLIQVADRVFQITQTKKGRASVAVIR